MVSFIKFVFFAAIFIFLAVAVGPKISNFVDMGKSQIASIKLNNVQTVATTYLQSAVATCQRLLASR